MSVCVALKAKSGSELATSHDIHDPTSTDGTLLKVWANRAQCLLDGFSLIFKRDENMLYFKQLLQKLYWNVFADSDQRLRELLFDCFEIIFCRLTVINTIIITV